MKGRKPGKNASFSACMDRAAGQEVKPLNVLTEDTLCGLCCRKEGCRYANAVVRACPSWSGTKALATVVDVAAHGLWEVTYQAGLGQTGTEYESRTAVFSAPTVQAALDMFMRSNLAKGWVPGLRPVMESDVVPLRLYVEPARKEKW